MKHRIEYALTGIVSAFARLLPRRARLGLGRALGSLVFTLDRRHREVTLANVDLAYGSEKTPEEKRAIARGAFRHFGSMLFEMITLGRPRRSELEPLFELEGIENLEQARRRGKGVILTSAHFGNWELHAIVHGFRLGKLHLIAREQDNVYLNSWLERIRTISGNEVVYKRRALRQMRRLLRDGESIAFVIDQNVHLEDAVFVDFFGRKAATTPVASWFALKTGASLLPAYCYPLPDGRYHAVYERPIDADRFRGLEPDQAILGLTQELVSVQERYIREHPDCWLWMHRRWRTRPPEEIESSSTSTPSPSNRVDLSAERVEEAALP
jgi:Kdo2-lipid IVA lauroyltransferase/acyltransferase